MKRISQLLKIKLYRNLWIMLIILTSIGCDQITKNIAREKIEYNQQINIISHYLILTKVENTGAFLGLGNNLPEPFNKIIMVILPLLVLGLTLFFLMKKHDLTMSFITGISLIIGGGIGNIIDRILYGSVTDFIHMDFILFRTGILNIADVSVTFGFFLLIYSIYIGNHPQKKVSKS